MLALPAQTPFYENEDWDDEIEWVIGEDELLIKDGWFNQTMVVSNPSLVAQSWSLAYFSRFGFVCTQYQCPAS